MIKVYPAGPIQGKDVLETIRNINSGLDHTAQLRELGFAPFPVFSDFMDIMRTTTIRILGEDGVYEQSIAWMLDADAVVMLPGWGHSTGAQQEKRVAEENGIPVFIGLEALASWRASLSR